MNGRLDSRNAIPVFPVPIQCNLHFYRKPWPMADVLGHPFLHNWVFIAALGVVDMLVLQHTAVYFSVSDS